MSEKCNDYSDLLSAYIDGELSADEEAALNAHICGCKNCHAELELLKQVKTACGHTEQAPENLVPNVMRSINAYQKSNKRFSLSNFKFTAIAAAVVLLVVAASRLPMSGPTVENTDDTVRETVTYDAVQSDSSAVSPVPATVAPASGAQKPKQNVNSRAISTDGIDYSSDSAAVEAQQSESKEIPYNRDFAFYILMDSDVVPDFMSGYPSEIYQQKTMITVPPSDREKIISALDEIESAYRIVEGREGEDAALIIIS